jgi:pyruvate/2-oxoglutarate dehydrogenase complex dihydrolipoamide dehydrogenase (E3) component
VIPALDAVVIGAGPAGEVAVSRLAADGRRVALVERELVGGECAYWACIPSKTLLRAPGVRAEARRVAGASEPELSWAEIAAYRNFMVRDLDDSRQVAGYREMGVTVHRGVARILGPGRVDAGGEILETERIVVATGSEPAILRSRASKTSGTGPTVRRRRRPRSPRASSCSEAGRSGSSWDSSLRDWERP